VDVTGFAGVGGLTRSHKVRYQRQGPAKARAPQRASVIDDRGRSGCFRAIQRVNPVAYRVAEDQPIFGVPDHSARDVPKFDLWMIAARSQRRHCLGSVGRERRRCNGRSGRRRRHSGRRSSHLRM